MVALEAAPDSTRAERAAAVGRVRREVATIDEVTLPPAAALQGRRQLQRSGFAMLPLRSGQSSDELIDSAATLREDLDPGAAAGGVTPYLVGQPTIWAGMQEISKRDLSRAEGTGFPIVALILLIVFGSLAAAALPLALGFVSVLVTGALIYFISLQMTMSVFVTNMASMIGIGVAIDYSLFILARYREEREAGRDPERGPGRGALDLGPGGDLFRPRGDHLPRRSLDGRQPGVALDGAGSDDRRRRLDPDRDDAAAGADRDARRPRPSWRDRRPGRALPQAPGAAATGCGARRGGGDGRRQPLLGRLDAAGDGAPLDRDRRRLGGAADPGDPGPLARDGDRGVGPVPQGQRCPRRQRTRLPAARRRHRPNPDRRHLRRQPDRHRPGRRLRLCSPGRDDPRGQRRRAPRLRRRRGAGPGDSGRRQRVRRGGGPGRSPARERGSRHRPEPGRRRRCRRRDRPQPRRPPPDQRLDVEDRPLRPRPQLPRPDGDAALADPAAEGGADEPALDRRRIRRPRRESSSGAGSTASSASKARERWTRSTCR